MLATTNIRFSYDGNRNFEYPDLQCNAGESILITGKSGCGKTTFLHILSGLIRNYEGKISLNKILLENLSDRELNQFRQHIGILFQRPYFIASLSVKDNLRIAARPYYPKKSALIDKLCRKLNIEHILNKLPSEVSAGELQRVSLVRSLINNPAVIFADEPTSSLDDQNASTVAQILITQSRSANAALIVVSHDARIRPLFDQIIELR